MDILSFILGLQKGKSMGGGSDSGEWICTSGEFTPTSTSQTIDHNLGVVPDIFIVYYFAMQALEGSNTLFITGAAFSEKLVGADMAGNTMGYAMGFNPSSNIHAVFPFPKGLEKLTVEGFVPFGDATSKSIAVGTNYMQLITNSGQYKWVAYAKK